MEKCCPVDVPNLQAVWADGLVNWFLQEFHLNFPAKNISSLYLLLLIGVFNAQLFKPEFVLKTCCTQAKAEIIAQF